ncbi:MAG: chorismate-binding protein, partial [Frankiaceae bacterium]|nr:chorismate-binding protein [Frankiaceae bacterium]
ALGVITATGMDLGLTIRTLAADESTAHLWAGGGITWSSDPAAEIEEAHAKAGPVLAALRS